jgi:hypothetical protein
VAIARRQWTYVNGLENFVYAQVDYPGQFTLLLEAIERRNQRLFSILVATPPR